MAEPIDFNQQGGIVIRENTELQFVVSPDGTYLGYRKDEPEKIAQDEECQLNPYDVSGDDFNFDLTPADEGILDDARETWDKNHD